MALPNPISQSQSPSSSRKSSSCNSPEFEFQFNPSFPSPSSLPSADQLFSNGLLLPLPLPLLPHSSDPPPPPPAAAASNRWSRLIFKKPPDDDKQSKNKDKEKKRDRKSSGAGTSAAELNINLWPFSRSRSAGNNAAAGGRGKSTRKVSSAPCSRSNSAGESKTRRSWPTSSPGRASGGVHLGRASPVWQLPRSASGKKAVKGGAGGKGKGRGLALNVPMCIGYRNHFSCRSGEASEVGGGGGPRIVGNSAGNLFSLRSLFSKKVY